MLNKSKENIKKTKENIVAQTNIRTRLNILVELLILIQQIGIYGFMVYMVLSKSMGIGSFTMHVAAIYKLSQNISLLIGCFIDINQVGLYFTSYVNFINLPDKKSRGAREVPHTENYEIDLVGLSFKYPNSEKYILKDSVEA